MSTCLSVILKRMAIVLAAAAILLGITLLFSYDIIKIDWNSFMEIQPSYKQMDHPLPVPESSIPIEGPVFVPNSQTLPQNPTKPDAASLARGQELYVINCRQCHGDTGEGNGPISAFLTTYKPANLTSPLVKAFSDGQIFMTISNGVPGRMPPLNENLTVSERWDVVNFVRTLKPAPK